MYERYAARGELLDAAILVHSYRLRATDASRYYVPCDGYQRKRDALDPRNFMEGHVEVLRFGDFADKEEHRGPDEDEAPFGFSLAEATSHNPTRRLLSAIDLTAWLAELPTEDRRMLALRATGHTLEETAEEMNVSISNIFARCKRLGHALAERASPWIEVKKRRKARTSSWLMPKQKDARTSLRPALRRRRSMAPTSPLTRGTTRSEPSARRWGAADRPRA